jgi:hypothetical protein
LRNWFDISTTENLCVNRYSVQYPHDIRVKKEKKKKESAPRIVCVLQFLRYDGPPPLPLESARLSLHHALLFATGAPHLNKVRLDDGAIEIECRNALRRGGGEMYAVQTTARRTEGRLEPPEGLVLLSPLISRSALFEDWKD